MISYNSEGVIKPKLCGKRRETPTSQPAAALTCTERDETSGYATWFTAGGAIRIAHYDVIDDVITRKL